MMERNRRGSHNNEKKPSENSAPPANAPKKPSENNSSTSIFVNHAAIAWDESRRKWIGNASQRSDRTTKDQIISYYFHMMMLRDVLLQLVHDLRRSALNSRAIHRANSFTRDGRLFGRYLARRGAF